MARGALDLSVVVVVVSSILSLFLDLIVAILVDLAADDLAVELVLGNGIIMSGSNWKLTIASSLSNLVTRGTIDPSSNQSAFRKSSL